MGGFKSGYSSGYWQLESGFSSCAGGCKTVGGQCRPGEGVLHEGGLGTVTASLEAPLWFPSFSSKATPQLHPGKLDLNVGTPY